MLFNPAVVSFDLYSAPVVIVGVVTVLFAFFVAGRVHWSRTGSWYLAFAGSVGLYAIGVGVSYAVATPEMALLWDRIGHVGVSFMPWAFFGTSLSILGGGTRRTRVRRAMFGIALVHVVLVWTTDLILVGNFRARWGWFSEYGIVGIVFLLYFLGVLAVVLRLAITRYQESRQRLHRRRIAWQIVAIISGIAAGVDVLPALGIGVYPFGYIPIAIFAVLTGLAILRYRMVDITPAVAGSTIINTLSSALIAVDAGGVIRIANTRAHDMLGFPENGLINRSVNVAYGEAPLAALIEENPLPFRDVEIAWTRNDETDIVVSVSASYLHDPRNQVVGIVYIAHDVSRRKRAERELERLAMHDDLTGLPNRKLFFDRFEVMLHNARRDGTTGGLLYIDLNGFKAINDRCGHQAGDAVLRVVAQRLRSAMREVDTVARIGGDEFVVLCREVSSVGDLDVVISKLRETLDADITLEHGTVHVGAAIGTAMFPAEGEDRDELLSLTDRRMYRDKARSSGSFGETLR